MEAVLNTMPEYPEDKQSILLSRMQSDGEKTKWSGTAAVMKEDVEASGEVKPVSSALSKMTAPQPAAVTVTFH